MKKSIGEHRSICKHNWHDIYGSFVTKDLELAISPRWATAEARLRCRPSLDSVSLVREKTLDSDLSQAPEPERRSAQRSARGGAAAAAAVCT